MPGVDNHLKSVSLVIKLSPQTVACLRVEMAMTGVYMESIKINQNSFISIILLNGILITLVLFYPPI